MAIFGSKKAPKAKAAQKGGLGDVVQTISKESKGGTKQLVVGAKNVIRRPRLTEKAANLSSQNVYTFDVAQGATKHDIVRAVVALYKVTPIKVNVVNTQGKTVSLRTRRGTGVQNALRKAYVYLKKGDTIDFAA